MSDIAAQLAELRVQYAAKLPARLATLAAAVEAARTDPSQLARLRHLVHQLRGSTGSYGLTAASEQLARIEGMLDERTSWDAVATAIEEIPR